MTCLTDFYREPTGDRALLAINDYYGAGMLYGITRVSIVAPTRETYCGKQAASDQYYRGSIDGRDLDDSTVPDGDSSEEAAQQ